MKRLPKTKYELFKKWYGLSIYSKCNPISDIFEDFELWCKNQEYECEVIETISEITGSRGLARQIFMVLQEGGYLNDSL